MDQTTRKSLTQSLSKLTVEIAAALRAPMRTSGPAHEAAKALHREEQVGDAFDLWTDLLSRRAAVLWVLKSLYVRVLEDRRLLQPRRILDAEDELFRHLAPNLGPTAYLRWVYRDLASARGGLPELFAPQPAELAVVPDALSQRLIDFWRSKNPDTGELLYRFNDEHFDGELMGDVYQDLDPVVKKRYALAQTPPFVRDFILDETLKPAIAEWGVETVRVVDPACGSGHFLLAAFKLLVLRMREKFPSRPIREVVEGVLARIVGIDINDYACGLARARLVMTALEACGENDLLAAASFHPRVFWADALEQIEDMEQVDLADIAPDHHASMGLLTPLEVRTALRPELQKRFHVVVGNPPYITEKDDRKRKYHKAKVGKRRRYLSAARKYSLGAPFTERMLELAIEGGWVGEITADSFTKREFGKPLIEQVLARKDLVKVVATSGAYIPNHGTPTVLLFARNRTPHGEAVRVVMGKRGEPCRPTDAATGRVWLSIVEGHATPGFENEFVSVADVPRVTMNTHEWNIGGGGVAELKKLIEDNSPFRVGRLATAIGRTTHTGDDEAFFVQAESPVARELADSFVPLVEGDRIRDWSIHPTSLTFFPYDEHGDVRPLTQQEERFLWMRRTSMRDRQDYGEKIEDRMVAGRRLRWFEHSMFFPERYKVPLSIGFAFKATHNHFALDRGGKVFKQTAPVIKLPADATEAHHLTMLAQLNSSIGNFWVRQVCYPTGGDKAGDGARVTGERNRPAMDVVTS